MEILIDDYTWTHYNRLVFSILVRKERFEEFIDSQSLIILYNKWDIESANLLDSVCNDFSIKITQKLFNNGNLASYNIDESNYIRLDFDLDFDLSSKTGDSREDFLRFVNRNPFVEHSICFIEYEFEVLRYNYNINFDKDLNDKWWDVEIIEEEIPLTNTSSFWLTVCRNGEKPETGKYSNYYHLMVDTSEVISFDEYVEYLTTINPDDYDSVWECLDEILEDYYECLMILNYPDNGRAEKIKSFYLNWSM